LIFLNASGRKGRLDVEDNQDLKVLSFSRKFQNKRKETFDFLYDYDIIHWVVSGCWLEEGWFKEKGDRWTPDYWDIMLNLPVPMIQTIHDPDASRYYPYLIKLASSKNSPFKETIFIREKVRDFYKDKFAGVFIPHPFIIDGMVNDLSNRENIIIMTSRVVFHKRQDKLVRIADKISGKIKIYGNPNRRYLHILESLPNWKLVQYCGTYPISQLPEIYKEAKIHVDLTNIKYDGGGTQYTFLEAMKYGCISITTPMWEGTLKDGLNVIINRDISKLSDDINRCLEDKGLREKIFNNNKEFLKKHDANVIIKKYVDVYKRVLGE